jgi:Holliday junction resolvase RusA-like endonuclease
MREAEAVITRTLLWTPHAKERARTVIKQGRHLTFTPKATREAEANLAAQWVGTPSEGPVSLYLDMWDDRIKVAVTAAAEPKSPKLRRGDIDNYTKLILDALNGVAWVDDRQIATLLVRKM